MTDCTSCFVKDEHIAELSSELERLSAENNALHVRSSEEISELKEANHKLQMKNGLLNENLQVAQSDLEKFDQLDKALADMRKDNQRLKVALNRAEDKVHTFHEKSMRYLADTSVLDVTCANFSTMRELKFQDNKFVKPESVETSQKDSPITQSPIIVNEPVSPHEIEKNKKFIQQLTIELQTKTNYLEELNEELEQIRSERNELRAQLESRAQIIDELRTSLTSNNKKENIDFHHNSGKSVLSEVEDSRITTEAQLMKSQLELHNSRNQINSLKSQISFHKASLERLTSNCLNKHNHELITFLDKRLCETTESLENLTLKLESKVVQEDYHYIECNKKCYDCDSMPHFSEFIELLIKQLKEENKELKSNLIKETLRVALTQRKNADLAKENCTLKNNAMKSSLCL